MMFPFYYRPSVDYCRISHFGCDHEHGSCLFYDVAGIDDVDDPVDHRTEWQKRMGVGERQPRDCIVTDGTRTRTRTVHSDDNGQPAGTQTEHRTGRVDATAFATPVTKKGNVR